MKYLSLCSGIEAASVAWHPLGWEPIAFSEIDPFASAVLKHRFPNVPNLGDMTKYDEWTIKPGSFDILVAGTPCQSFSVAGLRQGLKDPRGNLMLTFLEIARRFKPRYLLWENVPGVLSSNGGRDFGTFLGALGDLGNGVSYAWAYRVLDTQWCRVDGFPRAIPQRRRRVFVVGCLIERGAGDWIRPSKILFKSQSLPGNHRKSRATREEAPSDSRGGVESGCLYGGSDPKCSDTVTSKWHKGSGGPAGNECGLFVAIQGNMIGRDGGGPQGVGASEDGASYTLTKTDVHAVGYRWQNNREGLVEDDTAPACRASMGSSGFHEMNHPVIAQAVAHPVAFQQNTRDEVRMINGDGRIAGALAAESGMKQQNYIAQPVPYDLFQITAPVNRQSREPGDPCHTLARDNAAHAAVAFNWQNGGGYGNANEGLGITVEGTGPLQRCNTPAVAQAMTVRRLTPKECERLQGFPDDWTMIPWRKKEAEACPDGPRYKACGNSMSVNVMRWIGQRIAESEKVRKESNG